MKLIFVLGHVLVGFKKHGSNPLCGSRSVCLSGHRRWRGCTRDGYMFLVLESLEQNESSDAKLPVLFSLDFLLSQPLSEEVSQSARGSGLIQYNIDLLNLAVL